MRTFNLTLFVLLCSFSYLNYADRYNSMSDANSPPTTFEDDPATSANVYQAESVEKPPVTVQKPTPVQKNPQTYLQDDNLPQDVPAEDTPPDDTTMPNDFPENPEMPSDDVGATPSQPS